SAENSAPKSWRLIFFKYFPNKGLHSAGLNSPYGVGDRARRDVWRSRQVAARSRSFRRCRSPDRQAFHAQKIRRILSPSGVRALDYRGHRDVRPDISECPLLLSPIANPASSTALSDAANSARIAGAS